MGETKPEDRSKETTGRRVRRPVGVLALTAAAAVVVPLATGCAPDISKYQSAGPTPEAVKLPNIAGYAAPALDCSKSFDDMRGMAPSGLRKLDYTRTPTGEWSVATTVHFSSGSDVISVIAKPTINGTLYNTSSLPAGSTPSPKPTDYSPIFTQYAPNAVILTEKPKGDSIGVEVLAAGNDQKGFQQNEIIIACTDSAKVRPPFEQVVTLNQ